MTRFLNPNAIVDGHALRLQNALEGALVRSARRQDVLSVAASGGLGSGVLAALLARRFEGTLQMITVAAAGAPELLRARLLAFHLGHPLVEIVLNHQRIERFLPRIVPLVGETPVEPALAQEWNLPAGTPAVNPVRTALGLSVYAAAHEAARHGRRLILGQGADELFGGTARYAALSVAELRPQLHSDVRLRETDVLPLEARIARSAGVRFDYPYLNNRVRALAQNLPAELLVDGDGRTGILRRVAQRLELPPEVVEAPLGAAPSDSGVAPVLRELAQGAGLAPGEYLRRFLA